MLNMMNIFSPKQHRDIEKFFLKENFGRSRLLQCRGA